jgi:hypothetical protein
VSAAVAERAAMVDRMSSVASRAARVAGQRLEPINYAVAIETSLETVPLYLELLAHTDPQPGTALAQFLREAPSRLEQLRLLNRPSSHQRAAAELALILDDVAFALARYVRFTEENGVETMVKETRNLNHQLKWTLYQDGVRL